MITSIMELITPSIATHYLAENIDNRTLSNHLVNLYVEEMLNNNWTLNHQGIAFYEDGRLADGQHRLKAIIKSNQTVEMMVSRGLTYGKDIDRHKKRTVSDAIKIDRMSDVVTKDIVAMINLIMRSKNNVDCYKQLTITEIATFANRHRESILFIQSFPFTKTRGLANVAIKTGVFRAVVWGEDKYRLKQFVEIFNNGKTINNQDISAVILRNHVLMNYSLFSAAGRRIELDMKCQYAVRCFLDKKTIGRIVTPKNHIFPLFG